MIYKGYDVELVEIRWRNYSLNSSISHDKLMVMQSDITRKDVLFDNIPHGSRLQAVAFHQNNGVGVSTWDRWRCIQPFSTYNFTVLSTQDYSILREALRCEYAADTFGPETDFWERVLKCKEMSKQGDLCGVFITAWAVAHTTDYSWDGEPDAGPDEWELIGLLNPDFTITEVGYSWGHKSEYGWNVDDPYYALNDYLTSFDFPLWGGW